MEEDPKDGGLKEFEENPYSKGNKKPEDVVRYFYSSDLPILPVVSKRGILIGILTKKDVISELSDLARSENVKIDQFIMKIARKMTFDELLPYGKIKEFTVINLFGELQGKWTRLKLFSAAEAMQKGGQESEAREQNDEQVLEWMIYLILEHIPRPLYALNEAGKTIFYNSHFEEKYRKVMKKEVDIRIVEKTFKNPDKNELITAKRGGDIHFYNKDLKLYYERVPMISKNKKMGYLIFCGAETDDAREMKPYGADMKGKSLGEMLSTLEKQILADALKNYGDAALAAESLRLSKKMFTTRVLKFGIKMKG